MGSCLYICEINRTQAVCSCCYVYNGFNRKGLFMRNTTDAGAFFHTQKPAKRRDFGYKKSPFSRAFYAVLYTWQNQKHSVSYWFCHKNGGSAEIRTLEPFRVAGFQDRCLQPLGHTSGMRRTINIPRSSVKTENVLLPEKQSKACCLS